MSGSESPLVARLYCAAGGGLLLLTATDWLVRPQSVALADPAGTVRFERDATLWEMFGIVNQRFAILALLGVAAIAVFGVLCLVWQPRLSQAAVVSAGWIATAAVVIIMLSTDGGYHPGTGAWLGLAVCAFATVGSSARWYLAAARRRAAFRTMEWPPRSTPA